MRANSHSAHPTLSSVFPDTEIRLRLYIQVGRVGEIKTKVMQTTKILRGGVKYLKTVNSFSTTHTFIWPAKSKVRRAVDWGDRVVRSITVASKAKYDQYRKAGFFWAPGNGGEIVWHP
jgi:formyltetrahydrofolate synthetase